MIPDASPAVRMSRIYAADPTRVFAAWTDPAQLSRWWGAGSAYRAEGIEVDLRPGGRYRLGMRHITKPACTYGSGEFREVVPGRRLVYTWRWDAHPEMGESLVTVEFRDHPRGCELVLVHGGFVTADLVDRHARGWGACLSNLRARCFPSFHVGIQAPLLQFQAHQWMVVSCCEGIDDTIARQRPLSQANCCSWLLAHMIDARRGLLGLLGDVQPVPAWSAAVATGAPAPDAAVFPPFDELRAAWADSEPRLVEALAAADDARLSQASPLPIPGATTLGQALPFLALHEAFHLGQLAYARRVLGLPHEPLIP